jgi:hypothetical protein
MDGLAERVRRLQHDLVSSLAPVGKRKVEVVEVRLDREDTIRQSWKVDGVKPDIWYYRLGLGPLGFFFPLPSQED